VIRRACTRCGLCADSCPTRALLLIGERRTPAEILEVVLRDAPFYQTSRGGLTLSGGEPLAQAEAARELLHLAGGQGLHTAVETSGYAAWPVLESLLGVVDLWLYDVKHIFPEAHRSATGVGNRRILSNLRRLLDAGASVTLRLPVIPSQNDDGHSLASLVAWIAGLNGLREVHLMPYNALARSKFQGLGLRYHLAQVRAPSDEFLRDLGDRLEPLHVVIGG